MKAELDTKARQMITEAKLYCTRARVAILKVLLRASGPLKQDQIAGKLTHTTMNKVTIYRTLDCLTKAGLVHRAFMHRRAWHFELAHNCTKTQCHPHFTCTNCGKTHCLMGISIPMAKSPYKGFVIQRQQVKLEGLCPNCA